jgi:hypothetical protein
MQRKSKLKAKEIKTCYAGVNLYMGISVKKSCINGTLIIESKYDILTLQLANVELHFSTLNS